MDGNEDLGLTLKMGGDTYKIAQKSAHSLAQISNPVENPPYNNWSKNQPSPAHAQGMAGKANLGQNIIVDGHRVTF